MEEQIELLLETSANPQSFDAIRETVEPDADRTEFRELLDAMVKDKVIRRFEDGVDYRGEPMVWYAPKGFKP